MEFVLRRTQLQRQQFIGDDTSEGFRFFVALVKLLPSVVENIMYLFVIRKDDLWTVPASKCANSVHVLCALYIHGVTYQKGFVNT